jgi:hypothetical protein
LRRVPAQSRDRETGWIAAGYLGHRETHSMITKDVLEQHVHAECKRHGGAV